MLDGGSRCGDEAGGAEESGCSDKARLWVSFVRSVRSGVPELPSDVDCENTTYVPAASSETTVVVGSASSGGVCFPGEGGGPAPAAGTASSGVACFLGGGYASSAAAGFFAGASDGAATLSTTGSLGAAACV